MPRRPQLESSPWFVISVTKRFISSDAMNDRRHRALIAIVTWLVCAASWQFAAGEAPPAAEPPLVEGKIQYVGPDTFLLLDAQGRPQPVLGMSYEEFVAAWKKLHKVGDEQSGPRFTIEELNVTGRVVDDHAELEAKLTVRPQVAGQLSVPLGMAGTILRERPQETVGDDAKPRNSEVLVTNQPQTGGFVVWMNAKPDERHRLTFQILRPLVRNGNETSVELNLPRALVSHFSLTTPTPVVDAAATEGAVLSTHATSDGGTQLDVAGAVGDFRLTWNVVAAERAELATVLSATGAIGISIDGHSIRSDAHLTVRSYGGSFQRFRVQLPPGAQLIPSGSAAAGGTSPGYRLVPDDEHPPNSGKPGTVTVEFVNKQQGPVKVDLSTEQPLGPPAAERPVELSGFAVLGAVRQYGDVAVAVADGWQLRWENGPYVRQIERSNLPGSLRDLPPTVAFEYDRQPWSLRVRVLAQPMVVHVTPRYRLRLGPDEARLDVHLAYQIPGARAFELQVRLAGWAAEPIESGGPVDRDRVQTTREGMLVLPLVPSTSRQVEIDLSLRRAVARDQTQLTLPLPVPEADTIAADYVTVVAEPTIDLLPDMSRSSGLAPLPVTDEEPVGAGPDGAQEFRYRPVAPEAVFAAQRSIRPSEVTAEIDTHLAIDLEQLRATQEITYHVDYQPLEELAFELPDGWSVDGGQIEILPAAADGKSSVVPLLTEARNGEPRTGVVRAPLAPPRLGRLRVRITYDLGETSALPRLGQNVLQLPGPTGARIVNQQVEFAAAANLTVSLDDKTESAWQPQESSGGGTALALTASGPAAKLPLVLAPKMLDRPAATTVERTWLQMWQAGSTIQDRAAIRFRTAEAEVQVELPPQASALEMEVLVDGQLAPLVTRQAGRLTVALPKTSGEARSAGHHTLELRYRRPAPEGLLTRYEFTPPQLVGAATLSEVYWQIVLPGDRHIVQAAGQLAPVDPRQWLEVFAGRLATMSQAELESWVGATSQMQPASAQNTYLFSGLAPVASIDLLTAPRWLIVLVASGAVLMAVSLWIYVPRLHRGWIVMLAALVLAALAVAYPGLALLVGQAAVLGVALGTIALLLQRWTASRTVATPPPATGSTHLRSRPTPRTDSYLIPSLSASSNATTAPLPVPELDR